MIDRTRHARNEESGIALVIVLIVLLLTSVLALEIKSSAFLYSKLAKNKRDDFLMQQAMYGQLEVLKQILIFDASENSLETLEDRWMDEKYTKYQKGPTEEELEERELSEEPISSEEFEITASVTDENRKFNLHNLEIEDDEQRKVWEQIFVRLLTIYREDFGSQAIGLSKAEDLLANLKEWIKRRDDNQGVPRPTTAVENQVLVTPDELLMVKGFTREMFYDMKPEEKGDEPIPGLYRYLTLWSDGRVNMNTAESPVVRALFREQDDDLAQNFVAWREEEAEEQPENADPDDEPVKNSLKSVQDLAQIDGFDAEAIQRNNLAATVIFNGNHFSVNMVGESPDGFRRQERWILLRNPAGCTTLLAEERNDPDTTVEEEE